MRAAPLPLLVAVGSFGLGAWLAVQVVVLASSGAVVLAALAGMWCAGCMLVGLVGVADSLSRYREAQRVYCLITYYGWQARIIKPLAGSRCQRDAVKLASSEAGCLAQTTAMLHKLGYRWHHLTPDGVVATPSQVLSRSFWRSVLVPGKLGPAGRVCCWQD